MPSRSNSARSSRITSSFLAATRSKGGSGRGDGLQARAAPFQGTLADVLAIEFQQVIGYQDHRNFRQDPGAQHFAADAPLHLREGYIETQGRSDAVADLIARSAAPLSALLKSVARLNGGGPVDSVLAEVVALNGKALSSDIARRLFPEYLSAVEHLTNEIDRWGQR